MVQPIATIHINTTYTTTRIGRQHAHNLEHILRSEFPDWAIIVIPSSADAVVLPIEDMQDNVRTEFRVRDLMTKSLMKAVDDCKNNRDRP